MKHIIVLFTVLITACTASVENKNTKPSKAEVNKVLDDWHKAAAEADFDSYFSYFDNDSSVFMGTDATERWTIAEFKPWAKPYFDRGKAWSFTPLGRHIYFSDNGKVSWFDEALATPNLGPSRGTGVMVFTDEGWKITHYNLTIPIPNELIDTFIPQIDSVLNKPGE